MGSSCTGAVPALSSPVAGAMLGEVSWIAFWRPRLVDGRLFMGIFARSFNKQSLLYQKLVDWDHGFMSLNKKQLQLKLNFPFSIDEHNWKQIGEMFL